ncbi:MAG: transcription termination factor Rho [Bacteroidaceae bacterium]|nr:transcription termination factor Rho [Bacteroidaceae bacterium]
MYNLEQLNSKELTELQAIATELGVPHADKLDKSTLIFHVLDEQAEALSQAAATEKPSRKRTRVSVKNVDRVYSASQDKTKKIDKKMQVTLDDTLFGSLSQEEKDMLTPAGELPTSEATLPSTQEEEGKKPAEAPAPAPKKRGRKKKEETATTVEESAETPAQPVSDSPAPKKRGRKKKEAEETAENQPSVEEKSDAISEAVPEATYIPEAEHEETIISRGSTEIPAEDTDFVIIRDIPQIEDDYNPMDFFEHGDTLSMLPQASKSAVVQAPSPKAAKPQIPTSPVPYNFDNIIEVTGVLEIIDNYGFLRSSDYNYLPSPDDVYVNLQQIKHWGLKQGDVVEGYVRPPRTGEKFFPLVDVVKINGCDPQQVHGRIAFEFLTPLFPDQKFQLCKGHDDSKSSRIVDLFSPIGKGQRALIVAQPKTGKTLLMKDIANSIAANHPEAYLMMLLIDERPEEVTDMARTVNAEVIASTFDAPAENHVKIAGIVLEKAKRMVECGHDVVIFLDSITRLARAYNTVSPASGKVLSGGVDANALHKPKRFFGAARNIEGGGSLTIIATALIDTGSKMDEVIFEEFKGTGNMELQLDRQLANKRVFPAVNLVASSTRRDDLLQDQTTLNRMWVLRKHIADMTPLEAMDIVMNYIEKTKNNEEFLISMNG